MSDIPTYALSVRQPWAWAIAVGAKDIENRTTFAVSKGDMKPKRIAIHASLGMTRDEYEDAAETINMICRQLGRRECPRPDELVRGAIIGAATVTAIVKKHKSPWFFGPRGLVLTEQELWTPIPASGALGYFQWRRSEAPLVAPLPWMVAWPDKAIRTRTGNVGKRP